MSSTAISNERPIDCKSAAAWVRTVRSVDEDGGPSSATRTFSKHGDGSDSLSAYLSRMTEGGGC
eukprot:1189837-Prorocentrum_minimum.AAC.1